MDKRDYYAVLGIARDAGEQELKSAYRQAALKFHPDRNPDSHDAEEKFKEAAEAYSVLSDPQKRAAYDRYGHAGVSTSAAGSSPFEGGFPDLSEIFGDFFFGDMFGGRGRGRVQRGDDLRYDLELSFEDAVRGMSVDIQVPRQEACSRCRGTGGEPEGGVTTCPKCRGRGQIVFQQGFLSLRQTCSQCGGAGQVVRQPCAKCRGQGYIQTARKLKVNIPAGVDNGQRLRLNGEGQPGPGGGPAGDLYVFIRVEEHPVFERRDNDLHCTIPINIAQAALGVEIEAPSLDGPIPFKIPEGTASGTTFRVRNKGVPDVNGRGRGDLYIHVQVKVPAKLTREQRKLFEELAGLLPADNQPDKRGLFEKVKDYFM
ncbi:MAG TPA: molecular chaperone DnaJ [Bryobacteraceae bacterium]|nr:molecular chaperone DnaJ [Bryobacteraceae bacterium]